MSTGFVLNIPQEMLNRLEDADKKIEKLAKTSEDAQIRIVSAFKSMTANGVDAFIQRLDVAQQKLAQLGGTQLNVGINGGTGGLQQLVDAINKLSQASKTNITINGLGTVGNQTQTAIDAINKLMATLQQLQQMGGQQFLGGVNNLGRQTLREMNKEAKKMEKTMTDLDAAIQKYGISATDLANKLQQARQAQQQFNNTAKQQAQSDVSGLIGMKGQQTTLNELKNYANELKRTMANLDPKSQEWKKLNDIYKQTNREIKNIQNSMKDVQKQSRSLMDISGQLARRLALVFSVSQITGYVKKLIEVRGEFELQQRSLQAILQNKDEANRIWQQTIDLAVRSPFRVKELVSYTKQLAAYRIESDKLFETNKMLADVSAGLGVDMQRLILAFGQVRSAAYLRGTELRQFTEAGIPILEQLAQYFTELEGHAVSVGDVFERVSKRMVSFADVEEIFRRMTSEGGSFYRMQEIQAETLKGMWSNLKDSVDIMLNEIGKANEGTLKGSIQSVKELVDGWRDLAFAIKLVLVPLGTYLTITGAIKFANTAFSQGLLMMAMNFKTTSNWLIKAEKGIVGLATKMGLGKTAAAGFAKALGGLASLGVAALIAGIVVGLVALITKLTSASRAAKQLNKDLQAIYNEDTSNLKTQVRSFESLVGRLKDVNKGSREHEEIISQLNSQYGEYLGFIVDEKTTYDQLASSIDSVTLALTRKAKMNTFEKAYSKTLESTNKQIAELEDRITKQAFKEGMTLDEGKTPLVPTQEEIDDIFGLIEKKVRETGKTITSYEQLNEIVSEYYGKDVEVAGTAIKNFTDITDYYLQQKEAELELDRKINDVYGDSLRSSAEARQAFADLEERQAKALKDAEKEPKWVKEDIRNQFAKEKIDLEVKYEGLDEATAELRKKTLDSMSATIKDVNEKIEGSVVDLGEKYANLIYIDTNEASKSLNEIAESTAASYKAQQDIIKQQNALKEAGTVYDAKMLENAELSAKAYYYKLQLLGRLDLLSKEEDKKEKSAVKILNKRIGLIKEMYSEYQKGEKVIGEAAEKQVSDAYAKTFKEAFEDTGINLTGLVIDKEKLTELQNAGNEAGEIFSEAMLAKMNEVAEAGTYIRDVSDKVKDQIKLDEGFVGYIYDDAEQAKVKTQIKTLEELYKYFDKATGKAKEVEGQGTLTIGYGHALQTLEEAKKYLGITLEQSKAEELLNEDIKDRVAPLNRLLDTYNELIVTQEQYDTLFNNFYQGGLSRALRMAFSDSTSELEGYIKGLDEDLSSWGSSFAQEWGDNWLEEFKQLETKAERFAKVLEIASVTTVASGSHIDKNLFYGENAMKARSARRAAEFRGDLEIVKLLEKAAVDVSQIDFTNIEGVVAILERLRPIAEKEGEEAVNTLNQAISKFTAEIGFTAKKDADKELLDDIQELFDQYDLSLELKKLNIPPDLAKSLFDVDYLDLEGLKKAVQEQESKFIGTDMEDEYKKFLEKIDDMEDKAAKERMKTYSKYLLEGMSERVKLKIEEMRKLKEIEESDEFTPEQKERIKAGVSKEARAEQQKQDWKDFQGSDMYTMMFEDLEHYGSAAIDALYTKLSELKTSLSDLPASEVKEIVGQIEKLENIQIERNPFESLKKYKDEVKNIGFTEDELQTQLLDSQKAEEDAQKYIDIYNTVMQSLMSEDEGVFEEIDAETLSQWNQMLRLAEEQGKTVEEILADRKETVETEQKNQGKIVKNLNSYKKLSKAQRESLELTQEWLTQVGNLFSSSKELMESLGVESDSVAMTIADTGSSMVSLIGSAIQFTLQLDLMGVAANSALGIIGWIAIALQAVATVLSAIFSAKDKALQKEIDGHLARAEKLHEKYEELSDAIDSAYDASVVRQLNKAIEKTIKLEIKTIEAAIAAEKAQKASKIDWGWVDEQEKAVKDLYGTLNEEHDNYIERWGGFGSEEARFDFIESMTQAWLDSFKETGDGLAGLEETWDEYFDNLAMKQMALRVSKAAIDQYLDMWDKYVSAESAGGEDLTEAEAQDLRLKKEQLLKDLTEKYTGLAESLGITPTKEGSGLSALSKSIQGVSESTAQVLESLLSSMRFYVADSNSKLGLLLQSMGVSTIENPQLVELRTQTMVLNEINAKIASLNETVGGLIVNDRLKVTATTQLDQLIRPRANGGVGLNIVND